MPQIDAPHRRHPGLDHLLALGLRRGPRVLMATTVVAGAVLLSACGDTASRAVGNVVDQATNASACAAVSGVQDQLAGLDAAEISPDQLSQLRTGAEFVSTAVGALPDLPAAVSEELATAQQRLETAADDAQANAQDRQSAVGDVVSGYADQLDDVATSLGC